MADIDRQSYFLDSGSSVVAFETIELSHPNFNQSVFFVRNKSDGLQAVLENDVSQFFQYTPMEISEPGSTTDLDYLLDFSIGDVGDTLPSLLQDVITADALDVEPTLIYRVYRGDTMAMLIGPITLKIKSFTFDNLGGQFQAASEKANSGKTGIVYTTSQFITLRGF